MKRFFLLLSLFVCFVTPAFGQENRTRAEAALKTGVKQYKDGKYEEALASYQDAAKFAPTAAGPYREMGKAFEILGRTQEAISSYEEYLKRRPQANDAAEIKGRLTALQAKQPKLPVADVKAQPIVPTTPATPASAEASTPLALAAPTKLERKFKVRPARVASLGVAVATVVVSSVFLVGGFNGLGGDAAAAAGDAGDIQGVARGLQLSPKQAKTVQQLGTIALSIKF